MTTIKGIIKFISILPLLTASITLWAQNEPRVIFDGQASLFGNYAPRNRLDFLFGSRYLPEVNYMVPIDSIKKIDFFASANIFGNIAFHAFDSVNTFGNVQPYRLWARFTSKQLEVRIGLQKIDFGVATVLRPLQWFNQVNPRDPLGITNGVYAVLGRYYFLNNANIWLWALYGNEGTKGFEIIQTHQTTPEIGGRVQYPIPRGELGLTYHYRTADSQNIPGLQKYEKIPENRYGIDAKWDLAIGLWLEASHIHKFKNLGMLTHQSLFNLGMDYTFGVGNGLGVVVEHLTSTFDQRAFYFENVNNTTALTLYYPLGLFDNLSAVITYNWEGNMGSAFLNYEHKFNKLTGYAMFFYNPERQTGLIENKAEYTITGPGIRLMLVYNH